VRKGSGIPAGGPGQGPARGYRWAPFAPGNQLQYRHGARSELGTDPVAVELADALLAERPDLLDYPEAVQAWARAEARVLRYADYHARVGYLDEAGQVRGGSHVAAAENAAARLRERLGLDPVSDVQLQRAKAEAVHLVADLEQIRERGRVVLERRRAELAAGDDQGEAAAGGP
jgi:hypothetical protein